MLSSFQMNKAFLILLKTLIYFLLYYVILQVAGIVTSGDSRFLIAFTIAIVIIILLQERVTRYTQLFVDKNFYRRLHKVNTILQKFNKELNTIVEYERLLEQLQQFLSRSFSSHRYALYLLKESVFELELHSASSDQLPAFLSAEVSGGLPEIFDSDPQFYFIDKLIKNDARAKEMFQRFKKDFFYVLPLISFKNAKGFLLFDKSIQYYLEFPDTQRMLIHVFQKVADFLETTSIYSALKKASLESELLLEIAKKITATLDIQEVLNSMMDSLAKLVSFDSAGIFLIDRQQGILKHMVTRGYDDKVLNRVPVKVTQGISGQVIKTRQPIIHPDVRKDPHYFKARNQTRSQITVPIYVGEEVIGVIVLESNHINHFTQADLNLLTSFSGLASIALSNAQLYEDSQKKKRLESELIVASRVQRALLPERPVTIPGVEIEAVNLPSLIVSGDFYDVVRTGPNQLGVAIADVAGKGAAGALLMAMLYAGFKSLLKEIYEVSEIVARLNNLLVETTAEGYFATFFFGIINRNAHTFTYCNAGHNPPIIVHKNKKVVFLGEGGIVIGFLPDRSYQQRTIPLHSGDYIVLYTDGVTEIQNSEGKEFGEENLVKLLKRNYGKKPYEMKRIILQEIQRFSGLTSFPDDITLIIVYYE